MAGTRGAYVLETDCADHYHGQVRLQVCTLARLDSAQTETTALLQQVLTMLQQGAVRQRSRTLSIHPQVEPADFNSQTTKVGHHPRLWIHTNGYHSQVVANTTTSTVTFSILSPDASLSYDRIKLRLEDYRALLASASDTIELSTENGRTVICRKQANEMEEYLDKAEILLRDVIQSRGISTLVALHHLCDLTKILDNLRLDDECLLTGDCALDLAEALSRRSLEFRQDQADTLALIAGLTVYRPRARILFIRAVSICEEVVANDASHSNQLTLLSVLGRAGYCTSDHLGAQWLGHAVQLTKELPPTMVRPDFSGVIYYNYGVTLYQLKQYANALEAYHESISIRRTLANINPAKYNHYLTRTLMNVGIALGILGKYDEAIVAYNEALEICMTLSAQGPLQYNKTMAKILYNYGIALRDSNRISEAALVDKQAISFLRNLAQTGNEWTKDLCSVLFHYGASCQFLGEHAEAVLAYQECIFLLSNLTGTDSDEGKYLISSLHNVANSFHALDKQAEANDAANQALERNNGRVLEHCGHAPNFNACFVCQRAGVGSLPRGFRANYSSKPTEPSGVDASHALAETSTSATSAHIHPTNVAQLSALGQPGMPSGAAVPVHLDPTAPSRSFPPSRQPEFYKLTDSSAVTPNPTGESVNVSVHRKRDKILGFFRRIRGQ